MHVRVPDEERRSLVDGSRLVSRRRRHRRCRHPAVDGKRVFQGRRGFESRHCRHRSGACAPFPSFRRGVWGMTATQGRQCGFRGRRGWVPPPLELPLDDSPRSFSPSSTARHGTARRITSRRGTTRHTYGNSHTEIARHRRRSAVPPTRRRRASRRGLAGGSTRRTRPRRERNSPPARSGKSIEARVHASANSRVRRDPEITEIRRSSQ